MRLFNVQHQGLKHWRKGAWLLASLVFVLLVLAGQKLLRLSSYQTDDFDYIASADEQCELHQQACYLTLPTGGRVGLTVTPANLPLLTPLEWQVSLDQIKAKQVVLDIVGLNMDMGYNRTTLVPATLTSNLMSEGVGEQSTQVFRGQALLPICTLDTMQWEARLLIETPDQQRLLLPFRFQTNQRLP
ncbi:MAG TPA: hypothetical protein ENK78_05760 [Thiothrix sp.]|nr:hypothetical protein [Thiothrix sp.]